MWSFKEKANIFAVLSIYENYLTNLKKKETRESGQFQFLKNKRKRKAPHNEFSDIQKHNHKLKQNDKKK